MAGKVGDKVNCFMHLIMMPKREVTAGCFSSKSSLSCDRTLSPITKQNALFHFSCFGNCLSPPMALLFLTADRCFTVSCVNSHYITSFKVLPMHLNGWHSGDQLPHSVGKEINPELLVIAPPAMCLMSTLINGI